MLHDNLHHQPRVMRVDGYGTQTNGDIAQNANWIPDGAGYQDVQNNVISNFNFLKVSGTYPCCPPLVLKAGRLGAFVPGYQDTATSVGVKSQSHQIASIGLGNLGAQATSNYSVPQEIIAGRVTYSANVPAIAAQRYAQISVATPAGVWVTGIYVQQYGSGTWWSGIPSTNSATTPTTGAVNVGLFMPKGFSCSADTLRIWVVGIKTDKALSVIQINNQQCNEGGWGVGPDWVKPANWMMLGAHQASGPNGSGNWYAMTWTLASSGGGTNFNWTTSAVTNGSIFGMPRFCGQDNTNNRAAGQCCVKVVGIQM